MEQFVEYELRFGPLDGEVLVFPEGFRPILIEFRLRGLKDCPSLFHQYEIAGDHYRHAGFEYESNGACWNDDAWPDNFANVKHYGRLAEWIPSCRK